MRITKFNGDDDYQVYLYYDDAETQTLHELKSDVFHKIEVI